jgi:hypothetical protein
VFREVLRADVVQMLIAQVFERGFRHRARLRPALQAGAFDATTHIELRRRAVGRGSRTAFFAFGGKNAIRAGIHACFVSVTTP